MSTSFFYENRAHQLNRLCFGEDASVTIPLEKDLLKLPAELVDLYTLLGKVVTAAKSENSTAEMDFSAHREFERSVVRLRFSQDPTIKAAAVGIIKAIFADAEYFSGLKPLPQYKDSFAYELLFPTWLNLLTATMLPQVQSGKPRLEGSRQGTLFEFLGKVNTLALDCEDDLVGMATFVASRFDAPICEELLQRLAEVFAKEGAQFVSKLCSLEKAAKDARQFSRWLQDFLTIKHSCYQWPAESEHPISFRRPPVRVLPKEIQHKLLKLEETECWDEFAHIARPLRLLINSDHLISSEYVSALNSHTQHAALLLKFIIQETKSGPIFLSDEAQACLAHMIDCEAKQGDLQLDKIEKFASCMAKNLAGFDQDTLRYFCRQFIKDDGNRKMVLDACGSDSMRTQLSDFVLKKAGNVDDDARFLNLMACVTVFSAEDQSAARNTLQAIDAVRQNRSIGNNEYSDLVGDIQANLSQALEYLSMPIMGASGKDARMASLYLTLNEVAETYASSGKVENFSVVRAKYSRLTNM